MADLDVSDDVVLETARAEAQESIDKALETLATGGGVTEMFAATGHKVEVVRITRDELRAIGSFDLVLPRRMMWAARHWVYRREEDGQPYVLSEEKNRALIVNGWVHVTAFMIDTQRRN